MKLYTEEQVLKIIQKTVMDKPETYYEVLKYYIPIELPSDEEIEDKSIEKCFIESPYIQDVCENYFQTGAKWLKEQILNQNK